MNNKPNPGKKVLIVRPDVYDLKIGVESGMKGVVLEQPTWFSESYKNLVSVRIPELSDETVYYFELIQLEVL